MPQILPLQDKYPTLSSVQTQPHRENFKKLNVNINKEKDNLNKNGIMVNGLLYTVKFKGIVTWGITFLLFLV